MTREERERRAREVYQETGDIEFALGIASPWWEQLAMCAMIAGGLVGLPLLIIWIYS